MVFSHAGASLWKHNLSRKVFLQPQRGGEDPQGGFICSSLLALETYVVGITVISYFMCWDLLSGLRDRLLSWRVVNNAYYFPTGFEFKRIAYDINTLKNSWVIVAVYFRWWYFQGHFYVAWIFYIGYFGVWSIK